MKSTAEHIAHNLNTLKDKTAIIIDSREYSYFSLKKKVAAIIELLDIHSAENLRYGLQLSNSIECYASLIALLVSGRTFVPLNEGFGLTQNEYIIQTAGIKHVIQTEENEFIEEIQKTGLNVIFTNEEKDETIKFRKEEFAYLLFTSGSTGTPKGVPIRHSNLDNFIQGIISDPDWDLTQEERFLQPFNLSFDLYVFTVYLPLFLGATFLTVPLNKIALYSASLLVDQKITVSLLVPSTMKIINKLSGQLTFDHLKYSFFCGEALYANDLLDWIKRSPNALQVNIYGPTEATVAFTKYVWRSHSMDEVQNNIVPIGVPFGQNKLGLYEVEGGKELLLGGPQLFSEYIGTNKNPFIDLEGQSYYRSGDLCEINENGNYIFKGRNDGQVKVDGYRIEIADVENKFKNIFPERDIVIIHLKNEENLCSLHAFFTGLPIENLSQRIEKQIPDYMVPRSFKFIEKLPTNMNGKTDRKKLKSML